MNITPSELDKKITELQKKIADLQKAKDYAGIAALDAAELASPSFPDSRVRCTQIPGYSARLMQTSESGDAAAFDALVSEMASEMRQHVDIRYRAKDIFHELIRTNPSLASSALEKIGLALLGQTANGGDANGDVLALSCAVKYRALIEEAMEANDEETVKKLVQEMTSETPSPLSTSQTTDVLNRLYGATQNNVELNKEIAYLANKGSRGEFRNKKPDELSAALNKAIGGQNAQEEVAKLTEQMRSLIPELKTTHEVAQAAAFARTLQTSYPDSDDGLELLAELGKHFAGVDAPNKYILLDKVAQAQIQFGEQYLRRLEILRTQNPEEAEKKVRKFLDGGKDNICLALRFSRLDSTLKQYFPSCAVQTLQGERDALASLNLLSAAELERFNQTIDSVSQTIIAPKTFEEYAEAFAKLAAVPEDASAEICSQRKQALDAAYQSCGRMLPPQSPNSQTNEEAQNQNAQWTAAFEAYKKANLSICVRILLTPDSNFRDLQIALFEIIDEYTRQNDPDGLAEILERMKSENLPTTSTQEIEAAIYGLRLNKAYDVESSDAELKALVDEGIAKSADNRLLANRLIAVCFSRTGEKNFAIALDVIDRLIAAEEARLEKENAARASSEDAETPQIAGKPVSPQLPDDFYLGNLKGRRFLQLVYHTLNTEERSGLGALVDEFAEAAKKNASTAQFALSLYEELWAFSSHDKDLRQYAIKLGEASALGSERRAYGSSGTLNGARRLILSDTIRLASRKLIAANDSGDTNAYVAQMEQLTSQTQTTDSYFVAANALAKDLPEAALKFVERGLDAASLEASKEGDAGQIGKANLNSWKRSARSSYQAIYVSLFNHALKDRDKFQETADKYMEQLRQDPELAMGLNGTPLQFSFDYPDVVRQIFRVRNEAIVSSAAKDAASVNSDAAPFDSLDTALEIMSAVRQKTPEALDGAAALYDALDDEKRGAVELNLQECVGSALFARMKADTSESWPKRSTDRITADRDLVEAITQDFNASAETLEKSEAAGAAQLARVLRNVQSQATAPRR